MCVRELRNVIWLFKTYVFFSHFLYGLYGSSLKVSFLYIVCYLIDKKGYRWEKKLLEKNCRFKKYAYFCDEKKRTFFLVIFAKAYIKLYFNHLNKSINSF